MTYFQVFWNFDGKDEHTLDIRKITKEEIQDFIKRHPAAYDMIIKAPTLTKAKEIAFERGYDLGYTIYESF